MNEANSQQKQPNESDFLCYEGRNSSLREDPYCFACQSYDNKTVVTGLKRCSRCHVAWYCGAGCQKKHFKHHRNLCRKISKGLEDLDLTAINLRNFTGVPDDNEVLESKLDTLGTSIDYMELSTRASYISARSALATAYWESAYESELKEVWEKSLHYYSEQLRLDAAFRNEARSRFRVPFILLYLNRDDEAYAFIRYWLKVEEVGEDDDFKPWFGPSGQGDQSRWFFANCRYNDIFKECPNLEHVKLTAPFLMAIVIIKLRIIASHDAAVRALDFTISETGAKRIQEVKAIVQEMLIDTGIDVAHQREQLNHLLDHIQLEEPDMFNATLKSEYLHDTDTEELDDMVYHFYTFPVDFTLASGLRLYYRVPGAADVILPRRTKTYEGFYDYWM
ncbi:hypothetical protein FisN_28Lu089 [Fistulifera solaris]|jgi:hypothetical protein|uniref:MYND-type domain-containing protein n=1 Tax=Fistulifera solaris TaxID=1519565 RepID=A0A1Z5KSD5_FISSO|nr:hypothetical protein FisN_28Lu089 [Fistulifera solaris]|eukprot:GAX29230.1 hypothetical protein FisN_28Lu089 [Fistulifera solaris]